MVIVNFRGFFDPLLDLLYPRKCTFCRRLMDERPNNICPECERKLPRTGIGHQSRRLEGGLVCYSPLIYKDRVRDALHRYKFGGLSGYSETFGGLMAECVRFNQLSFDIVTWVPLNRQKLRRRGYDQAFLLAKAVSESCGEPVAGLLRKTGRNQTQSEIQDPAKRRRNVRGMYTLADGADAGGKTVLLIDDIATTGATLSECTGVLKAAGAERIICLTAATVE